MKSYHLAITTLLTSFCLTACDAQNTNKTEAVKSPASIPTEKLELKKQLGALDRGTEAKKSITPASPPLQTRAIVRPVNQPQPSAWPFNPQRTPQSQTQPSAQQFDPQAARQA